MDWPLLKDRLCIGLLLVLTAVQACHFPVFMRFAHNQSWLSSWRKEGPNEYSVLILTGSMGRMVFHKRTYNCSLQGCAALGTDRMKSAYSCIQRFGRHKRRFIVRSELFGSRDEYCLEVVPRDTLTNNSDIKIFHLRWDQRKRMTSSDPCTFMSEPVDQDVWIPSLLQDRSWWNDCPFSGGYQARMFKGHTPKPLCPDKRLFRFDVECVAGEGMLWVFPHAECNPFTNTLETQFYCYIAWKRLDYTHVILYNSSNIAQVYTMRYEETDVKMIFQLLSPRRRSFYKASVYLGAVEVTSANGEPTSSMHRQRLFYSVDYRIGNPQDPDCDDEVINCAERCHETRAYINCKKTCSRPRDECLSNRDNNKCQFKKNYVSTWTVHGPNQEPFTAHIKNEVIEFYGPGGLKQMRATCYNEIQTNRASLNDRYVIEVNEMPKGCRRRRLCLELYQGRYIMRQENNANTLRYRMSRSKIANLYADHNQLCSFQPDPKPLGEKFRSQFMKMMVCHDRAEETQRLPDKCGFYRSMQARAHKGRHYCDDVAVNDWSSKECEFHGQLHIDHSACRGHWPMEELVDDYQCVSTFYTSHLGLTVTDGENGNIQLHITRNLRNNEYNCWFFDKTSDNAKLYKFPTSDCAISRQTQRAITVDEGKASIIYTVFGDGSQPCTKRKDNPVLSESEDDRSEMKSEQQVLHVKQRESMYRGESETKASPVSGVACRLTPLHPLFVVSLFIFQLQLF